jgi:UDP-N-acetyl-D-mannosaminuronic acid transferase (WecB/TagA/CpsF family)
MELQRDPSYRQALLEADLAIPDSGFMVLLWNLLMRDGIRRISGLEYLELLLRRAELRQPGLAVWVMPSDTAKHRALGWLHDRHYRVEPDDFYIAPRYHAGAISDPQLVEIIRSRRPRHVIVGIGGGTQEKLGLYLKRACDPVPSIHCVGAAVGFLSGDQVRIPVWADRWVLGWLFRCASNPGRFLPRYIRAFKLAVVIWRYRARLPDIAA